MATSKPIIGLAGGIGSGKSLVADQLASLGAAVFNADAVAKAQYEDATVKKTLVDWWGKDVLKLDGQVDLSFVASIIFDNSEQRKRLENLIHPLVSQARDLFISLAMNNSSIKCVVLDVPLLFEVGLNELCDCVIFVECDLETRKSRVMATRGWTPQELGRREKTQWALDKKRRTADHVVSNSSSQAACLAQVQDVFKRILQ